MCGIAGLLDPGRSTAGERLERMADDMAATLSHRGPDGVGTWCDASRGIAFGHRRLAIIDRSDSGGQPMISACGRYTVVFNGEIYNFREMRRQLEAKGRAFRGGSDTEVLVEAISFYGLTGAVQRCQGMFAIAVWDGQDECLHLVRDRIGEKPLYYGSVAGHLAFASELKAFKSLPGFAREIDPEAVDLYLRYTFVPTPRSMYRGVYKLPPGTVVTVLARERASFSVPAPYWSLSEAWATGRRRPFEGDDAELLDEVESLLTDAVRQRMIADVPLGAFLSGGVDSSLTVALMQRQSAHPVKTFTVAVGHPALDEAVHARAVADYLGTEHTEVMLGVDDAVQLIPQLPCIYDEPFADPSQIPTTLIAREARREITVGMSGDGGDELFAGYNRHRGALWWRRLRHLPAPARRALALSLTGVPPRLWDRTARLLAWRVPEEQRTPRVGDKLHRLAKVVEAKSIGQLCEALAGHWDSAALTGVSAPDLDTRAHEPAAGPLDAMMLHDLLVTLPDDMLVKVDRATMRVGLEGRIPLLDHRLVGLAARIPASTCLRDGRGKWPLRQLVTRYLPSELVDRPKQGFDPPIGDWLRGPLREWAGELLTPNKLQEVGLEQGASTVARAWHEHQAGRRNHDYRLWTVLTLSAWNEAQGDNRPCATSSSHG